jgi:hypothetical protein
MSLQSWEDTAPLQEQFLRYLDSVKTEPQPATPRHALTHRSLSGVSRQLRPDDLRHLPGFPDRG